MSGSSRRWRNFSRTAWSARRHRHRHPVPADGRAAIAVFPAHVDRTRATAAGGSARPRHAEHGAAADGAAARPVRRYREISPSVDGPTARRVWHRDSSPGRPSGARARAARGHRRRSAVAAPGSDPFVCRTGLLAWGPTRRASSSGSRRRRPDRARRKSTSRTDDGAQLAAGPVAPAGTARHPRSASARSPSCRPSAQSSKMRRTTAASFSLISRSTCERFAVRAGDIDVVVPEHAPPVTWPARALRTIAS